MAILALAAAAMLSAAPGASAQAGNGNKAKTVATCQDLPSVLAIGSSTVFPITDTVSRQYGEAALPMARSSGSGLGILNFLVGATDAGAASRKLKPSDYEKADCDPASVQADGTASADCQGVLPVETSVGNDLLAIIVPADDPRTSISLSEINGIFSSPPDGTKLCVPDPTSGTYSFFVDNAVEPAASALPGFADDAELTSCVASNANSIGFVGISWATRDPAVKALSVDGVDPNTVEDITTYPFSRPLIIYTDANAADSDKGVNTRRFVCAILDPSGQAIVSEVGYRPLSDTELSASRSSINCDSLPAPTVTFAGPSEQIKYCRDSQEIVQLGSSTVFPIAGEMAKRQANTFYAPTAASAGSSLGIRTLLAGAVDFGTASRALKGSDYEALGCDASAVTAEGTPTASCQGVLPRGNVVGYDSLSFIVHPNNPLFDLPLQTLVTLFQGATGGASITWNEALGNPAGAPAFYSQPVEYYIPDKLSGTSAFASEVMGVDFAIDGYNDDMTISSGVASNEAAIGFLGAAFVTPGVLAMDVDGVAPSADGYAFTRPLFFYSDANAPTKVTDDWNCKLLSTFGQEQVTRVGYVALTDDQVQQTLEGLGLSCSFNPA